MCDALKDVICHPFHINSQYFKTWLVDSPEFSAQVKQKISMTFVLF